MHEIHGISDSEPDVQMPNGEDRPTLEIDNVSEQEMRAATGDFEDVFNANVEQHQKDDIDDYADDDDYDNTDDLPESSVDNLTAVYMYTHIDCHLIMLPK